jgi:outer membrane murein-binding lipoprotein Lpp
MGMDQGAAGRLRRAARMVLGTIVPCLAVLAAGCGGSSKRDSVASAATPAGRPPASLATVESAAEDIIDLALAGDRAKVVTKAKTLVAAAGGPAARALRRAGVSPVRIDELRRRSDRVLRLAPRAPLIEVALASNRAFELVPEFFARFRTEVPAPVLRLDYLDFEAKLQARAGHARQLVAVVRRLETTWSPLRPQIVKAGGRRAARAYDAHVHALGALAGRAALARAEREAQHGLDLVDELEAVYDPAEGAQE